MNETVKRIEDLLSVNQLFSGRYERLWSLLESHRIAERADALGVERDGCRMSDQFIESTWSWLNRNRKNLRRWA